MILYKHTLRKLSTGGEAWKGAVIGSNSLETPAAGESSLVTPKGTGMGGVIVPCFAKGAGRLAGNTDSVRFQVELTARDLLACAEAAGFTLVPAVTP